MIFIGNDLKTTYLRSIKYVCGNFDVNVPWSSKKKRGEGWLQNFINADQDTEGVDSKIRKTDYFYFPAFNQKLKTKFYMLCAQHIIISKWTLAKRSSNMMLEEAK